MKDIQSSILQHLSHKDDSELRRLAIAVAELVFPLLQSKLPAEAIEISNLLRLSIENPMQRTGLAERASSLLPDSEDNPEMGEALPAGESIVSAIATMEDPSPENAWQTISYAYTAIEYKSYLDLFPDHLASGDPPDPICHESVMEKVRQSTPVLSFIERVGILLDAPLSK